MCELVVVCLQFADIARSTSKPVKVLEVILTWIQLLLGRLFYMCTNSNQSTYCMQNSGAHTKLKCRTGINQSVPRMANGTMKISVNLIVVALKNFGKPSNIQTIC